MENAKDPLSRSTKWTITAVIVAAVIAVSGQLLIRKWYSVDLRYKEGAYYTLKDYAITLCEIKNYGHITANSIRVHADFNTKIIDVQVPYIKSEIIGGGIKQNNLTIQLDRIVAGNKVTVFYAVEEAQETGFIKSVECQEGLGRTGQPILLGLFFAMLLGPLVGITGYLVTNYYLPTRKSP